MTATFDRETVRERVRKKLDGIDDLWSAQPASDLLVEIEQLCGLEAGPSPAPPSRDELGRLGGAVREFADRMWRVGSMQVVSELGRQLGEQLGVGFRHLDAGDDELRGTLLEDLWRLLEADLRQGRNVYARAFAATFRDATTASERRILEEWFRELLDDVPEDDHARSPRRVAGHWMLEYLADDLDDEAIRAIGRKTRQFVRLTRRALENGRDDEALERAGRVEPGRASDLCELFLDRDRLDELVDADVLPDPTLEPIPVGEIVDIADMLLGAGDPEAALPWIEVAVREGPLHRVLPGLREAAEAGECWTPRVEEALLGDVRENWPVEAVEHHLEFGDVGAAFDVWESHGDWERDEYRRLGRRLLQAAKRNESVDIAVTVALALADDRIEERGRDNYRRACAHLETAQSLVGGSDYPMSWSQVVAEYEDQLDRLPAFRDEAEEAGLVDSAPGDE